MDIKKIEAVVNHLNAELFEKNEKFCLEHGEQVALTSTGDCQGVTFLDLPIWDNGDLGLPDEDDIPEAQKAEVLFAHCRDKINDILQELAKLLPITAEF